MYYACIENNMVVGVLDYEPNVPDSVTVKTITTQEYTDLKAGTHYFDTESMQVQPRSNSVLVQQAQAQLNHDLAKFLQQTDWQVLRHIRQKALGVPTSLSEAEYLDLELSRNQAAAQITH
jgi:hypothetical protein